MNVHDAYVKMLNTVVPDLKPWLEDRIARGQSAYQILAEFRTALAGGPDIAPRPLEGGMTERARATLADYPDAALLDELHARLTRHVAAAAPHAFDLTDEAP